MAEAATPLEALEGVLTDAHQAAAVAFADALGTDEATQAALVDALAAKADHLGIEGLLETTTHLSRAAFALSGAETNGHENTAATTEPTEAPSLSVLATRPLLDEDALDTWLTNIGKPSDNGHDAADDPVEHPSDTDMAADQDDDPAEEPEAEPAAPLSLREARNYFEHSFAPGNLRQFVIRIMPPHYVDTIRDMKHNVLALQLIADMALERYMETQPNTQAAYKLANRRQAAVRRWCGIHEMDMEPSDIAVKQNRNTQQVMADIHHVIDEVTERFSREVLEELFEAGVNHTFIPLASADQA